jgi:hypothetical protein
MNNVKNFVLGALLGIGGLSAFAAFSEFTAGTVIRAADVNAKFNDLDARVTTKQNRVTGTCAVGSSVSAIAADGTVTCASSGLALPFTGSIAAASAGSIGLNISSSDPTKTAIKGLGGNYGVVGESLAPAGVGVLAASSGGGAALEVSGAIKISGTSKPAFVHEAVAANIVGNYTCMDNPLTNSKPNAIVMVTQNFNPNGTATGTYNNNSVGVFYNVVAGSPLINKWCIFNQATTSLIPVNAAFNVLVINQ